MKKKPISMKGGRGDSNPTVLLLPKLADEIPVGRISLPRPPNLPFDPHHPLSGSVRSIRPVQE